LNLTLHITLQQLWHIALYVFVLMIIWTVIKFVFKLTVNSYLAAEPFWPSA